MRILITFLCFLCLSCSLKCKKYNFSNELDSINIPTPRLCFSQSRCCKKWLLNKLKNSSEEETRLILSRLEYFPEIDEKTIDQILKTNSYQMYKKIKERDIELSKEMDLRRLYKQSRNQNIKKFSVFLPKFLTKMENNIMKNILEGNFFLYQNFEQKKLLVKKNQKVYIYSQKNWHIVKNRYKNFLHFFFNFDTIIFNEDKTRVLIEIQLHNGVMNYILENKRKRWQIIHSVEFTYTDLGPFQKWE